MISRAWVAAGVAVAGALVLVWFARSRVTETPEAVVAAPVLPPEQAVADTNASLRVEPAFTPPTVTSTGSAADVEPRPTLTPLPGDTSMPAHSDVPDPAARDRRFAAEPVDTAWAPGAEAELLRRLAESPGLKVLTMRVECRTTACRLEITRPAGPATDEKPALADVTLDLRPTLIVATRDMSAGASSTTIMYFARPGQEACIAIQRCNE